MPDINYGAILEALNDKVDLDGSWSFPSSQKEELTLGDSGTSYTAPADGCFFAVATSTSATAKQISLTNSITSVGYTAFNSAGWAHHCAVPAKKGETVTYTWIISSGTFVINKLYFIYAQKTN